MENPANTKPFALYHSPAFYYLMDLHYSQTWFP